MRIQDLSKIKEIYEKGGVILLSGLKSKSSG